MYSKSEVIKFLKEHYPNEDTVEVCRQLGLSTSAVQTLTTRNGIHKSQEYLEKLHIKLMKKKEEKYLASIPDIKLTQMERNIIVGSILGDGSITYTQRSRNAYYREHFSLKQKEYREWKMNSIRSIQFRIEKECNLKSPSHPVFSDLYKQFFIDDVKTITQENIKLLDHPIGLACLYMDDGTLMISTARSNNRIRIHPSVGITTLCYSKQECEILKEHISKVFGLEFNLCSHPHGKGWTIKISRLEQITKFFNIIHPYCMEVPCLRYKWDFPLRLEQKRQDLINIYGNRFTITISSVENIPNYYTNEDLEIICKMKKEGKSYNEIAAAVGRTIDAIGYKIHHLKQLGRI